MWTTRREALHYHKKLLLAIVLFISTCMYIHDGCKSLLTVPACEKAPQANRVPVSKMNICTCQRSNDTFTECAYIIIFVTSMTALYTVQNLLYIVNLQKVQIQITFFLTLKYFEANSLYWGETFLGNVTCPISNAYQWHCWGVALGVWCLHCHNEMLSSPLPGGVASCLSLSLRVSTPHLEPFCTSYPESSAATLPAQGSDFENSSMPCRHNDILTQWFAYIYPTALTI